MATLVTETGRELFIDSGLYWSDVGEDFIVIGLSTAYVYDETDTRVSHLSGVIGDAPVIGRAFTDGNAMADDVETGIAPSLGVTCSHLYIARDTGVAATSELIVYMDHNNDATPFNRPGDGTDMPIRWPGGVVFTTA